MKHIILGSASPRRKALLLKVIPTFEVKAGNAEERSPFVRPHKKVMDLTRAKAACLPLGEGELIIAADTLVYRKGRYYGKPKDRADAVRMLSDLAGKTHAVYTGVCLRSAEGEVLFYDRSEVVFKDLSAEEIERYLDEYAPFDKAGAYGIQDGVAVARYRGSFDNIMGLPTERLGGALVEMGVTNVHK